FATAAASSRTVPAPPGRVRTSTASRTTPADPPRATTPPRCAASTIARRPTAAGPTGSSDPAPTSGPARTATGTSATPPAPSTSPRRGFPRPGLVNHRIRRPARSAPQRLPELNDAELCEPDRDDPAGLREPWLRLPDVGAPEPLRD